MQKLDAIRASTSHQMLSNISIKAHAPSLLNVSSVLLLFASVPSDYKFGIDHWRHQQQRYLPPGVKIKKCCAGSNFEIDTKEGAPLMKFTNVINLKHVLAVVTPLLKSEQFYSWGVLFHDLLLALQSKSFTIAKTSPEEDTAAQTYRTALPPQ